MGYYVYYSENCFSPLSPISLQYIFRALSESAYLNWIYFDKMVVIISYLTIPPAIVTGCFQFYTIVNSATVNTLYCVA